MKNTFVVFFKCVCYAAIINIDFRKILEYDFCVCLLSKLISLFGMLCAVSNAINGTKPIQKCLELFFNNLTHYLNYYLLLACFLNFLNIFSNNILVNCS